jgi:methionine-rich copper-binding protein CopC
MLKRLALATLALTLTVPAFAHSHPKTMSPDKGATVSAPTEVSIEFSEALDPKFSSVTVLDDKAATLGKPSVLDPADNKHMTVALPTLAPGVYTVKWSTAALDGHKLAGEYTFTVK